MSFDGDYTYMEKGIDRGNESVSPPSLDSDP